MGEDKQFERIPPIRPGEEVLRRKRRPRRRLRMVPNVPAFFRFLGDMVTRTPLVPMLLALVGLWLVFCAGLYFVEHGASGSGIYSYGRALYWGIAAFSTAGIADTPVTAAGQVIGGLWIITGAVIFFGTIVASLTAYFMLPMRRPSREIVGIVQYNLEKLDDLSLEELEILRETTMGLIDARIERVKKASS